MSEVCPTRRMVLLLACLVILSSVLGPGLRTAQAQAAAERAREQAARAHAGADQATDPGEQEESDEGPVVVVPVEWDRTAKSASELVVVRTQVPLDVPATLGHRPVRFETVRALPSAAALLAVHGTLLDHAAHSPPTD